MKMKRRNKEDGNSISSVYLPHYNRKRKYWEVKFPDRWTEMGSVEYVVSEYIRDGLIFRYNRDGEVCHSHQFDFLLSDIIEDVKKGHTVNLDGFESDYSTNEIRMIYSLIYKLRVDLGYENH